MANPAQSSCFTVRETFNTTGIRHGALAPALYCVLHWLGVVFEDLHGSYSAPLSGTCQRPERLRSGGGGTGWGQVLHNACAAASSR